MLLLLCCAFEEIIDERAMSLLLGDVSDAVQAPAVLMSRTRIALQQVLYVAHNGCYRLNHLARKVG